MYASVDLEGVGSDGVDGPPQALDGSVVAGGVGAMDTLADMAAAVFDMAARVLAPAGAAPAAAAGAAGAAALGAPAAAPVAEGEGVTEQRIRQAVPGLPVGNLTVAVLKSQLQMYGGAMFVLDDKTRHKAPNEHIFNKGAIKRDELLDAWRRFMDKPGPCGAQGRAGFARRDTPSSSARCCCHCSHSASPGARGAPALPCGWSVS